MAIYFLQVLLIITAGSLQKVDGKYYFKLDKSINSQQEKKIFMLFSFGILILVAGLRSYAVGTDLYMHYAKRFIQISEIDWSQLPEFSLTSTYEIGYCIFTKLISQISANLNFFIFSTSLFIYGAVGWFIYKNSSDVKMSTLLFVLSGMYYNSLSMIRQSIAISIILIGYEFLKKDNYGKIKKYLIYSAFVLIAASVHASSIICILLILFDCLEFKQGHIVISIIVTGVFFFLYNQIFTILVDLFGLSDRYDEYSSNARESIGHINVQSFSSVLIIFLGFAFACYYLVMNKSEHNLIDTTDNENKTSLLMFLGMLAFICRFMIFKANIINRFSWFFIPFIFILYPLAVKNIDNYKTRKSIKFIIYCLFAMYFVMMTFRYERTFHHTIPYEFYWEIEIDYSKIGSIFK